MRTITNRTLDGREAPTVETELAAVACVVVQLVDALNDLAAKPAAAPLDTRRRPRRTVPEDGSRGGVVIPADLPELVVVRKIAAAAAVGQRYDGRGMATPPSNSKPPPLPPHDVRTGALAPTKTASGLGALTNTALDLIGRGE